MANARLVYSTDDGDRRQRPAGTRQAQEPPGPTDGIVRVSREKGGRRGKTVTLVRGLPPAAVKTTAAELKRLCAAGATVTDGVVELQGDHRHKVAERLRSIGYTVKLAGG